MGSFLNPPTHPEHSFSVASTYGNTFSMSLSSAAKDESLNESTRIAASNLLKLWEAPTRESPEVQDWIAQILGYFKGCYSGQDSQGNLSWNASDLRILPDIDPVLNCDIHAGVHFIRKYYPHFTPTKAHFESAYWGHES